ncbi:MAG: type II toxin-antitoxin system PemK/MazF family toxin [Blautia sp.]|nr:type II toxin-antitoxin system PemK/MazF family toxin [Blautia sp.]
MSKKEKPFYPTGIHGIRRGDIYYVDFGRIEDAVGSETAKKRPVLIVQNNLGNKISDTVICLCLTPGAKEIFHIMCIITT